MDKCMLRQGISPRNWARQLGPPHNVLTVFWTNRVPLFYILISYSCQRSQLSLWTNLLKLTFSPFQLCKLKLREWVIRENKIFKPHWLEFRVQRFRLNCLKITTVQRRAQIILKGVSQSDFYLHFASWPTPLKYTLQEPLVRKVLKIPISF